MAIPVIFFNVADVDKYHLADGGQLVDKNTDQFTDIVLLDECIDGTITLSVNFVYERICYRIGYVPLNLVAVAYEQNWAEQKWSVGILGYRGNGGLPAEQPLLKPYCSLFLKDASTTGCTEEQMATVIAVNERGGVSHAAGTRGTDRVAKSITNTK